MDSKSSYFSHLRRKSLIKIKSKDNDLCQSLFDALRRNDLDFVHLLIEYGASFDKLTVDHLEQLYSSTEVSIKDFLFLNFLSEWI